MADRPIARLAQRTDPTRLFPPKLADPLQRARWLKPFADIDAGMVAVERFGVVTSQRRGLRRIGFLK